MVQAPALLAEGVVVVRVTGRHPILNGTLEELEKVLDALMGALLLDETVTQPDIAIEIDNGVLQIEFLIDTDDVFQAAQVSGAAVARAFAIAQVDGPGVARFFAHEDLLRKPSNVELAVLAPV